MKEPEWLSEERENSEALIPKDFKFRITPKKLDIRNSKNVKIHSIHDIIKKDNRFAKGVFLFRHIKADRNPYAAYLNANFNECNFMFVEKGKKAELDICLENSMALNFIFLGEGSSLRLSSTAISDSLNVFEIKTEPDSKVDVGFLKHKGAFSYNGQACAAGTGSMINSFSFHSGNGFGDFLTELRGAGASASHIDLSIGGDQEEVKVRSKVLHAANDTKSEVVMKGVAQDSSSTVFNGIVDVESNGKGSKSYLEQHILLLDKSAKAEAKPVLEIKNNDVECSHSAAIRQIEEKKLFYLMSRGLNRKLARTTAITGFLRSAINKIEDTDIRNMFKPPFMKD